MSFTEQSTSVTTAVFTLPVSTKSRRISTLSVVADECLLVAFRVDTKDRRPIQVEKTENLLQRHSLLPTPEAYRSGFNCLKPSNRRFLRLASMHSLPGNFNKKFSYCKQISRQHSCRRKFWPSPRAYVVNHVINFRTSSLTTMQNLVANFHAVCACRETQKFWNVGPWWACLTPWKLASPHVL